MTERIMDDGYLTLEFDKPGSPGELVPVRFDVYVACNVINDAHRPVDGEDLQDITVYAPRLQETLAKLGVPPVFSHRMNVAIRDRLFAAHEAYEKKGDAIRPPGSELGSPSSTSSIPTSMPTEANGQPPSAPN